jgi:hypothetical protein
MVLVKDQHSLAEGIKLYAFIYLFKVHNFIEL